MADSALREKGREMRRKLLGDAAVTFTLSFVALCAYVMHQPVLMAKLQVALAPVENDRDTD